MDDFVDLSHVSLTGEDTARPPETAAQPIWDTEVLCEIVRGTLRLPPSNVGAVACTTQLLRDLRCGAEKEPFRRAWIDALEACLVQLKEELPVTESTDALIAGRHASRACRAMITPFSGEISSDQRMQIRRLRARVVTYHLSERRPMSEELGRHFVDLATGNGQIAAALRLRIRDDRAALIELREEFALLSSERKLLTSLIETIDRPPSSPPILAERRVHVVTTTPDSSDEDDDDPPVGEGSNPDGDTGATAQPGRRDLIGVLLKKAIYARAREMSGVSDPFKFLQSFELKPANQRFVADLATPDRLAAEAALNAELIGIVPDEYADMPLSDTGNAACWVNVRKGFFSWRLEAGIARERWIKDDGKIRRRPPVRKSLSIEHAQMLRERLNAHPSATNFAELYAEDFDELKASAPEYLARISPTSHRLTLGRLRRSFARVILEVSNDEAYARAVGPDFTVGAPASPHYTILEADRTDEILTASYSRVGLSGKLACNAVVDTGSLLAGKVEDVADVIRDAVEAAGAAWNRVRRRNDRNSLVTAQLEISTSILTLLVAVLGPRAADDYPFARHTIDLELGLALLADKMVDGRRDVRVVPLPAIVISWLRFYLTWLSILRYRFLKIDRNVSARIDSILRDENERADIPLFFAIDDDVGE